MKSQIVTNVVIAIVMIIYVSSNAARNIVGMDMKELKLWRWSDEDTKKRWVIMRNNRTEIFVDWQEILILSRLTI